jgi:aspartyl/asparaginyl beta-hydroxylase (cupin superfamily)
MMHSPVTIIIIILILLIVSFVFGSLILPSNGRLQRDQNFYEQSREYPQLNAITLQATTIRDELQAYAKTDWIEWPEKELVNNKSNNDWKVIPLMAFGKWSAKHCLAFPQTVTILKQIRGLRSAGFSKLGPGTILRPHQGWEHLSNKVLRCHYGINVPENCGIWCNGESRDQHQDEWLVFDDSKMHSAWNRSTRDRIVLILDLDRPRDVARGTSTVATSEELNQFVANM